MEITIPYAETVKETIYKEKCPECGELYNDLDTLTLNPAIQYVRRSRDGGPISDPHYSRNSSYNIVDAIMSRDKKFRDIVFGKIYSSGEIRRCSDCMDDMFISEEEAIERNRL